MAEQEGRSDQGYWALWALVESYYREGRFDEAFAIKRQAQQYGTENYRKPHGMWTSHMLTSLHTDDWDQAEEILGEIEDQRNRQQRQIGRMGWLAGLTEAYLWLSGQALQEGEESNRLELKARAFQITERMRARVLLDEMVATRAIEQVKPELREIEQDIDRLTEEIRLAESREDTERLKAQREQLFARKGILRNEAVYDAQPGRSSLATLHEVRGSLQPHQAMLSFQLGYDQDRFGNFSGGAWVMMIHRDAVRAFRTADVHWLQDRVKLLEGLLESRETSIPPAAEVFYRQYLAAALESLPEGVEELIIIPDGILNRLPFALLRPDVETPALARRFRLMVTPSATVWSRWWTEPESGAESTALVLADPDLSRMPTEAISESAVAPLPYARQEARAVTRFMGGESQLWLGPEASEEQIKNRPIEGFQVLHFAAHAISNDSHPELSAIFLAPGSGSQDGRLEVREIVDLDLDDKVIVLSACQSASGQVMLGEGVLGLARAFFQARARVVVGSLWPLRDDDAAFIFEEFYRYLGQGQSVSGALQMAQIKAIEEGLPPQAWSGILVMGDGGFVPFPDGVEPRFHLSGTYLSYAGILLAAALFGGALLLRRRQQPVGAPQPQGA
ncbi:MAG TPA: CHAT domain-containing protein [Acidobacteriota bacterium]|nr:CHAT domain-containing protein [Acidobacteriota bacterium]